MTTAGVEDLVERIKANVNELYDHASLLQMPMVDLNTKSAEYAYGITEGIRRARQAIELTAKPSPTMTETEG